MHQGFNARPDLSLPVDAQGGGKLASMERLYSILTGDAVERGLMREEFYFLSDEVLGTLKRMQGLAPEACFPGYCIEQAYLILAECEQDARRGMLEANGMPVPDRPLLPGGPYFVLAEKNGQHDSVVIQIYRPRTEPTREPLSS